MNNLVSGGKKHMEFAIHTFKNYWLKDVSFAVLLFILIFTVFVLPILIEYDHIEDIYISAVFLFMFFTGIWSSQQPVIIGITALLFVSQLILRILRFSHFDFEFYLSERILGVVNILVFILLNIRLLFRDSNVNLYRVFGAVNVYLSVAILGAFLFEIIHLLTGSGIGGEFSLKGMDQDYSLFIYFSLVSLTTVGFGELYPVGIMSKMLSVFLSTIGILYPAVIIAKLVSASTVNNDVN
jgi:hypothetical protein